MFSKTTDIYDLVYSFKNYEKEAMSIRELIQAEHPRATSILDVACGTAEHARFLTDHFDIDGIDLQPEFVEAARRKVAGRFAVGDMRAFRVDKRYDVVQCLFSSIGYLQRPDDVVSALSCFRDHLAADGIVIVEPWLTPEAFKPGHIGMAPPVDRPDLKIVRMHLSACHGNLSRFHFHYLVATPTGIEHRDEVHELAMYSVAEMQTFFRRAGLLARHDPVGIFGRGLYVARREN